LGFAPLHLLFLLQTLIGFVLVSLPDLVSLARFARLVSLASIWLLLARFSLLGFDLASPWLRFSFSLASIWLPSPWLDLALGEEQLIHYLWSIL
ncbi:hypothetical protein Dimus_000848, partial [Dionaea muscipula]